jgi:cell pole-organizing protein PopZ
MDTWLQEMKAVQERTGSSLRDITAEIRASNKKLEVLQDTLVSRIDIQQARTECTKKKINTKMDASQEIMADLKTQIGCLASHIEVNQVMAEASPREMKASQKKTETAIHSSRSELERTVKHQVENCKDLQFVMTAIGKWTGYLKDNITDTNDCYEAIADTRKDIHEELGLMFRVEAQTSKAPAFQHGSIL